MTPKDDPWANWDPAKDERIYIDNIDGKKIEEIETCKKDGNKYILKPNTPYPLKNVQSLVFAGLYNVDLSYPALKQMLENLQDHQYIILGRENDCNVRVGVNDNRVSRHHVIIQKVANELFVTDTSMNGTAVIKKNYQ